MDTGVKYGELHVGVLAVCAGTSYDLLLASATTKSGRPIRPLPIGPLSLKASEQLLENWWRKEMTADPNGWKGSGLHAILPMLMLPRALEVLLTEVAPLYKGGLGIENFATLLKATRAAMQHRYPSLRQGEPLLKAPAPHVALLGSPVELSTLCKKQLQEAESFGALLGPQRSYSVVNPEASAGSSFLLPPLFIPILSPLVFSNAEWSAWENQFADRGSYTPFHLERVVSYWMLARLRALVAAVNALHVGSPQKLDTRLWLGSRAVLSTAFPRYVLLCRHTVVSN